MTRRRGTRQSGAHCETRITLVQPLYDVVVALPCLEHRAALPSRHRPHVRAKRVLPARRPCTVRRRCMGKPRARCALQQQVALLRLLIVIAEGGTCISNDAAAPRHDDLPGLGHSLQRRHASHRCKRILRPAARTVRPSSRQRGNAQRNWSAASSGAMAERAAQATLHAIQYSDTQPSAPPPTSTPDAIPQASDSGLHRLVRSVSTTVCRDSRREGGGKTHLTAFVTSCSSSDSIKPSSGSGSPDPKTGRRN